MAPEHLYIEAHTESRPDHSLDSTVSQTLRRTTFVHRFESTPDGKTRIRINFTPAEKITEADIPAIRSKLEEIGLTVTGDNLPRVEEDEKPEGAQEPALS